MVKSKTGLILVILMMAIDVLIASPSFSADLDSGKLEGIKVHGHWKIEVFNPNGKRVSVTEFDNAYSGQIHNTIPIILSGQMIPGAWSINLDATSGAKPCDTAGASSRCSIGESGADFPFSTMHSTNLTVTVSPNSISLSGSVSADYASTINEVESRLGRCSTENTPSACKTNLRTGSYAGTSFTTASLVTPPSVVPGQLIQVTVTISFS